MTAWANDHHRNPQYLTQCLILMWLGNHVGETIDNEKYCECRDYVCEQWEELGMNTCPLYSLPCLCPFHTVWEQIVSQGLIEENKTVIWKPKEEVKVYISKRVLPQLKRWKISLMKSKW